MLTRHTRGTDRARSQSVATTRRDPPRRPSSSCKDVPFSFCLIARTKKGCAIVTLARSLAECSGPLQSAPRAHYARFCGCMHIQGACLLFLSLSARALRRGIITRGGLLLVLLPASPPPPPLSPLFSSSASSTAIIHRAIGARRSIYIATRIGGPFGPWKLGKKRVIEWQKKCNLVLVTAPPRRRRRHRRRRRRRKSGVQILRLDPFAALKKYYTEVCYA